MKFTVHLNVLKKVTTPAKAIIGKLYEIINWPSGDYNGRIVTVFEDAWTGDKVLLCVNNFSTYWTIKNLSLAGDDQRFQLRELEKGESITLTND